MSTINILDFFIHNDGHSNRKARSRRFSIHQSQFGIADNNEIYHDGWFRDQFRCTKSSFDFIYNMIMKHWEKLHGYIGSNALFYIRDRVAVTLYYLIHAGSIVEAAKTFGMSKSSAIRYVWQVINVIIQYIRLNYIKLPNSQFKWQQIADGFENICGFPNCCFVIDGCLFEIERPYDFEGWYCRKGYPAINAQVIVDNKTRILSYDLRLGSANDKSIFNYSKFGQKINKILPNGKYGLGDAGYVLSNRLLTSFPIEETMQTDESLYNYLHSKTRITVERTFGSLKNRFRIFKTALNQKADEESNQTQTQRIAMIIETFMVLHNILIDLNDDMNNQFETNVINNEQTEIDENIEISESGSNIRNQLA